MTNKFKLGDKVKTLVEKKEDGSICKKGTIGTVCDVSHEDCIMIEANDANGEWEVFGFAPNELEKIK